MLSGYAGVYCERLLKIGLGSGGGGAGDAARTGAGAGGGARSREAPGSPYAAGRVWRGGGEAGAPGGRRTDAAAVPLLTLNLQLSLWGALLAGVQVLGASSAAEAGTGARRPLTGFGGYAWSVVGLQALGGLVVSVVIKHTDNIIKGESRAARDSLIPLTPPPGFAMAISILLSWALSIPIFGLRPSPIFLIGLILVVASVVLFSLGGVEDGAAVGNVARGLMAAARASRGSSAHVSALLWGVAAGMVCAVAWRQAPGLLWPVG